MAVEIDVKELDNGERADAFREKINHNFAEIQRQIGTIDGIAVVLTSLERGQTIVFDGSHFINGKGGGSSNNLSDMIRLI